MLDTDIFSLIAATALHHGLVLATGNSAHYQRLQPLGYPILLDNWRSQQLS
jgi:tRNA(fMet)-specific endonuclease VapC